mgnify:CR=1 FL=1
MCIRDRYNGLPYIANPSDAEKQAYIDNYHYNYLRDRYTGVAEHGPYLHTSAVLIHDTLLKPKISKPNKRVDNTNKLRGKEYSLSKKPPQPIPYPKPNPRPVRYKPLPPSKDKKVFEGKTVTIIGGGDSALDWAVELSKVSKVNLVHRRDEFRGAQATLNKVKELTSAGKINLLTKYQLVSVSGSNKIESIDIKSDDGEIKNLKTDYVLGFFGLIMQLGPIANWGLNIDKKTIAVDTEKFETNQKGIYAVGDICTYPGKLRLILSGFHEGALAARACFKLARPNEKYRFEFTTTSSNLLKRLGKKD